MSAETRPTAAAFARPESKTYDALFGLTKREYFAAAALTGLTQVVDGKKGPHTLAPELAARSAVAYADALIAALNDGGES